MRGYDSTSYGDGFADVYDEWYAAVTDVDATVGRMLDLAGPGGSVLELGAGTGRLAIPLAAAGLRVVGIDSSRSMLDQATTTVGDRDLSLTLCCGDMVDDLPSGVFDAALIAYNTLFNLLDAERQRACFGAVAARLRRGGHFVVEAVVPDEEAPAGSDVSVRSMSTERVVLSVSDHQPNDQRTSGQFIELTESGGVRLRPWVIRWSTVDELDEMAHAAGFALVERVADMAGTAYDDASVTHVSTYRLDG